MNEQQAVLDANDGDGDGWDDDDDDFNTTLYRSISCPAGEYGAYGCIEAHPGSYVPNAGMLVPVAASGGLCPWLWSHQSNTVWSWDVSKPCGPNDLYPAAKLMHGTTGLPTSTIALTANTNPKRGNLPALMPTLAYVGGYGDGTDALHVRNLPANSSSWCCDDAPPGYYVDTLGANASTPCPADIWHPIRCDFCSDMHPCIPRHMRHTPGSSSVEYCPIEHNPLTGANSSSWCLDADPGHYVDQQGQFSQEMCPPGTYNPSSRPLKAIASSPLRALFPAQVKRINGLAQKEPTNRTPIQPPASMPKRDGMPTARGTRPPLHVQVAPTTQVPIQPTLQIASRLILAIMRR